MKRWILVLGAALAASLPAQTTLVGFCTTPCQSPIGPFGGLALQKVCETPNWCMTTLLLYPEPWAGGTAWDFVLGAAWTSNGRTLGLVLDSLCSGDPCQCQCKHFCQIPWAGNGMITGLAVDNERRLLFLSEDTNTIYTYSIGGQCQLKELSRCPFGSLLPSRSHIVTGLAYDKIRDLLFIAAGLFQPSPAPGSTMVYVSKASDPCNPFCKFEVKNCGRSILGPATGLAFDDCLRTLFVTDGDLTTELHYAYPCTVKEIGCCPAKPVKYHGLCVRHSACTPDFSTSGSFSQARCPCTAVPVPCPTLPSYAGGLPYVGNSAFKLTLTQAPNPVGYGNAAVLMLNLADRCREQVFKGPCCGEKLLFYPWVDGYFFSLGVPAGGPSGPPPCGLAVVFPLPIPVAPELCCYQFCGQWMVFGVKPAGPTNEWLLSLSPQFDVRIGGTD